MAEEDGNEGKSMMKRFVQRYLHRMKVLSSSLFLVITAVSGCTTRTRGFELTITRGIEPWYTEGTDLWYRASKWGSYALDQKEDWERIDNFLVVPGERQEEAIRALNKSPIIKLSEDEYIYYGGEEDEYDKGNQYLVRSLHYYSNIEGYDIHSKENIVIIFHHSRGRLKVPMRKRAIVIETHTEIDELFVACDQAE